MVALASTDVTVTVERRAIEGKTMRNRVSVAFGNGTLTYPSGGVPMPAFDKFGLRRNLDFLTIFEDASGNGYVYKYDKTNNKLRIYVQGYDHGTGGSVTLDDYPITAAAGVTSGISVSLTTGAGAAVARLGPLIELTTTDAPAATTLYAEAAGW